MARGIEIPFTLDPREFVKGLKVVDRSLEDIQKEFDDVEKSAEDNFRDIGDEFEEELRDMERRADKAGDRIGDDLGDGVKRGGKFGEIGGEVADEFTENFGEAIRSGNPGDAILETFTSLGPALGAIGLGTALVAGVINQFIQGARERSEQVRATIGELANIWFSALEDEALDTGQSIADNIRQGITDLAVLEEAIQTALNIDDPIEAWKEVNRLVNDTGLSTETVTQAIAGNEEALAAVSAALEANKTQYNDNLDAAGAVFDTDRERSNEILAQNDILDTQKSALDSIIDAGGKSVAAAEDATVAYNTQQGALKGTVVQAWELAQAGKDYTNSVISAKQEIALLRGALDQIPLTKTVTVEVIESVVRQDIALGNRAALSGTRD